MNLLVLDTETGGVSPEYSSLMEVACVVIKNEKIVHKYSSYVKSYNGTYTCTDFARKMHGITDEMLEKQGKYPHNIIIDLQEIRDVYFDGEPIIVVAHNSAFDISFVKKMFLDAEKNMGNMNISYNDVFSRNAIDTASLALVLKMQNKLPFERCSLDNILKFYKVEMPEGKRHTALADAEQTAKAFMLMYKHLSGERVDVNSFDDVYETGYNDQQKITSSPER
ncbi:MAG: 3'-5' exonuclease [Clostridia bacterium]|nr:3'-5' exonuclease [Clostridia bacterium]